MRLANPEEEQRLSERRRAGEQPFDHRPAPDASAEDLDLEYFKSHYYLPQAVARDALDEGAAEVRAANRSSCCSLMAFSAWPPGQ